MTDSNSINLASLNPYFALVLLAICQVSNTVGDVVKEYIKSSSGDKPKADKFVPGNEALCIREFRDLVDQVINKSKGQSVHLVQSARGCKLIVEHGAGSTSEAWIPK
jgi:hypothetical protein